MTDEVTAADPAALRTSLENQIAHSQWHIRNIKDQSAAHDQHIRQMGGEPLRNPTWEAMIAGHEARITEAQAELAELDASADDDAPGGSGGTQEPPK